MIRREEVLAFTVIVGNGGMGVRELEEQEAVEAEKLVEKARVAHCDDNRRWEWLCGINAATKEAAVGVDDRPVQRVAGIANALMKALRGNSEKLSSP